MNYELFGGMMHWSFGTSVKGRFGSLMSGSMFTQLIGTFSTVFVAVLTLLTMGFTPSQIRMMTILATGDDLCILSPYHIDIDIFSFNAYKYCGVSYSHNPDLDVEECEVEFIGSV
jgi:hypothetical protein